MKMKLLALTIVLWTASLAVAQTFDCFGGLVTYSDGATAPVGSGGPNQQSATCSQTGTAVTCTVTNGAKYGTNEPMVFTGSSTALDWSNTVCAAHNTQGGNGAAWNITNIAGNTLTMTSVISQTVTSHTGTIKPARWYISTINNHVGFVTPLDHWFFAQQVVQASDAAIARYGSNTCNTAKGEIAAWDSLGHPFGTGYNATGQSNSDNNYYNACSSNPGFPFQIEGFLSSYCSDALAQGSWGGGSQPCKDMNWATNNNYNCQGISRASLDYFDPIWGAFVVGWLGGSNDFPAFRKSIYFMGADHQDSGVGGAAPTNAGWAFNTSPTGKNDCHQGILTLATSPMQAGSGNVLYGSNHPSLFFVAKNFSKARCAFTVYGQGACTTPPTCDYTISTDICSLADWLIFKYTNIAGVNTAWGMSYTTIDSSGTQITLETIGTGNGSQTVFPFATANANIDPFSIQVLLGGVQKGFDCPQFAASCTSTSGKGALVGGVGTTITAGTITYATGASGSVTFSVAPGAGVLVQLNYTVGGWGASTPGTGLLDEDGRHEGLNGVCPIQPASFANSHAYSLRDLIATATSWQYATQAGTSQSAGTPGWSALQGTTTSTGSPPAVFTSVGPPVCGTGGTYTGTLPNAQMGADLDQWLAYLVAAYASALKAGQNTVAPDTLNWCSDQMGVWQSPPNKYVLQAATIYCDVAMGDMWDSSQDGAGPIKYDYFTANYPGPITNYQSPVTTQSAFPTSGNVPIFSTQQLKGQWWYNFTTYWLNAVGADGKKHGADTQWTSNIDGIQNASFGFETSNYNPYDTIDPIPSVVPACLFNPTFACGSDGTGTWNATDSITDANCGNCISKGLRAWTLDPGGASTPPTVYVSTTGNDSTGTGSITAPYATWDKGRTAIDALVAGCDFSGAATVVFRGGTYYMGQGSSESFTSSDNGCSSASPIIYESYPGETAAMSGGFRTSGWTVAGGITCGGACTEYQLSVPVGTKYFENLWYNGVRRLRPRLSATSAVLGSTLQVVAPVTVTTNTGANINCPGVSNPFTCIDRFTYNPTDPGGVLSTAWANYQPSFGNPCSQAEGSVKSQEGDIEMLIFEQGQTSKLRISCIDTSAHIIYFTGPLYYFSSGTALTVQTSFQANHRYIIENVKDALTQPQQFFLDVSTNPWTLSYLAAAGENPNTDVVVIPQLAQVATANNFQFVNFYRMTFEHDNWIIPWANTTTSGSVWLGYSTAAAPYNTTFPYQDGYPSLRNELKMSYSAPNYTNTGMTALFGCFNCQNHEFAFNTVTQTAGGGIEMWTSNTGLATANLNVHDNSFYDLGGFASRIGMLSNVGCVVGCPGNTDTDANIPNNYYYFNNLVTGYGRVIPSSIGLIEGDVRNGIYYHNDITFGYHAGFQLCALSCALGVFGSNYHGSSNNVIAYNNLHHIMQGVTSDGGALYLNVGGNAHTGAGNLIANNLVHDVTDSGIQDNDGFGGECLYLDNNTGGTLVFNNIAYFCSDDPMWNTSGPQQPGWANLWFNNIAAYGRNGGAGHGGPAWYNSDPPASIILQNIFKRNIFLFDRIAPNFYVQRACSSLYNSATGSTHYTDYELWDQNTYWGTGTNYASPTFATFTGAFHNQTNQAACANGSGNWTFGTFAQWQGTINGVTMGEDPNGQVVNPGFAVTGPTGFIPTLTVSPGSGFDQTQTNLTWNTAGRINPPLNATPPVVPDTIPGVQSYTPTQY